MEGSKDKGVGWGERKIMRDRWTYASDKQESVHFWSSCCCASSPLALCGELHDGCSALC